MTTVMTNFDAGEPRTMIAAVSRPLQSARAAYGNFMRARRRSQDVFQMTQVLNRLNDRQLSALGLVRERLYNDLEERYNGSFQFVDDVLALVESQTAPKAITHDTSGQSAPATSA